jgi:hypothetical protein
MWTGYARYKTERGAARYAEELAEVAGESDWTFSTGCEPAGFAWAVYAHHPNQPRPVVVGKRPRGGPRPWLPVDSDGHVHGAKG